METLTSPTGFDELLTAVAAWLLLGASTWAVAICGAAAIEAASAGRLRATSWVACPPGLRRCLLTGLGVALAAGPAASASSREPAPGTLTAPTAGLGPPVRPSGGVDDPRPRIAVRAGDALWRIAERRLPPDPQLSQVADLVERLHRRNRELIGPDPDLIRPGQRLVVPALPHESDRHLEENP